MSDYRWYLRLNLLEEAGIQTTFGIAEVSVFGAVLLLALCGRARDVIQSIDWGILILFGSLFVLTQAVWNNGIIAAMAAYLPCDQHSESAFFHTRDSSFQCPA